MSTIDKINLLIKRRGITGAELTRAVGIKSTGTYSQWNKGTTQISNANLKKIADYFEVPVSALIGDDEGQAKSVGPTIPPGFLPMPEMAQVPLVGRIACGTPITAEQTVWIPTNGGTKYHKDADCSDMINPQQVSLEYAEAHGFEPCKLCY